MIAVQSLANTILKKGFEENIKITHMKLQKLIYFTCCRYLQTNTHPLISERFETWEIGPVLHSIHYAFSGYLTKPIKTFTKNAKNQVKVISKDNIIVMSAVDYVWNKYKHYTAMELTEMILKDGTAWCNAFMNYKPHISEEDMKNEEI